jgi:hypothetical protein
MHQKVASVVYGVFRTVSPIMKCSRDVLSCWKWEPKLIATASQGALIEKAVVTYRNQDGIFPAGCAPRLAPASAEY